MTLMTLKEMMNADQFRSPTAIRAASTCTVDPMGRPTYRGTTMYHVDATDTL